MLKFVRWQQQIREAAAANKRASKGTAVDKATEAAANKRASKGAAADKAAANKRAVAKAAAAADMVATPNNRASKRAAAAKGAAAVASAKGAAAAAKGAVPGDLAGHFRSVMEQLDNRLDLSKSFTVNHLPHAQSAHASTGPLLPTPF